MEINFSATPFGVLDLHPLHENGLPDVIARPSFHVKKTAVRRTNVRAARFCQSRFILLVRRAFANRVCRL